MDTQTRIAQLRRQLRHLYMYHPDDHERIAELRRQLAELTA